MKPLLLALVLAVPAVSCSGVRSVGSSPPKGPSDSPRPDSSAVTQAVLADMDRTADPCRDFYRYACGGWLDRTKIPADEARWGRGFNEIREHNRELLRRILEDAAQDPRDDPDRAKLGSFYTACMNEERIETTGFEPLKSLLTRIGKIQERFTLLKTAGQLHSIGVEVFFHTDVDGDFKDPSKDIAYFLQGGLGLPDREYYLKDDEASKLLLGEYEQHIRRMLHLLGQDEVLAGDNAKMVVDFEIALARISLPREELRDPEKLYHRVDLEGLRKLTPKMPWAMFLEGAEIKELTDLSVGTPEYFEALEGLVADTRLTNLKAYLRWQLLHAAAPLLPRAFVEENFAFYGKKLEGRKELPPRWKRCVDLSDESLGDILGRQYVERVFAGSSKTDAIEMIEGIEGAFRADLADLGWMDAPTRGRAEEKMRKVLNKIGYPDRWKDYSSVQVEPDTHLLNVLAARNFEWKRRAAKVGKPADRSEWYMTPPTVDAYYNPSQNEMVFPAGILQPPFFAALSPAAMNYGGIGTVMGHELTHGFDDQGRKFDGTGKLTEWWEPGVIGKFEERARCVEDLYATYEVQPGIRLNGKLTLGENIADMGGVKQAYRAWRAWAARHGASEPMVLGLTNDQLFFVGFAQSWCEVATPEIERVLVTVDPHSPPRYRVLGPLTNFPDFASAFRCAEGTPMHPQQVCEVW